ncbi:hypothetical protein BDZ91DRAFT_722272 [Kalaharituber pfeilii]|nr:hypothetical protein BDZ91DRAFT_722272 [Kalaharituber pfeilii]
MGLITIMKCECRQRNRNLLPRRYRSCFSLPLLYLSPVLWEGSRGKFNEGEQEHKKVKGLEIGTQNEDRFTLS